MIVPAEACALVRATVAIRRATTVSTTLGPRRAARRSHGVRLERRVGREIVLIAEPRAGVGLVQKWTAGAGVVGHPAVECAVVEDDRVACATWQRRAVRVHTCKFIVSTCTRVAIDVPRGRTCVGLELVRRHLLDPSHVVRDVRARPELGRPHLGERAQWG